MSTIAWAVVVIVAFVTGFSVGWHSRMRIVIARLRQYQRDYPEEGS